MISLLTHIATKLRESNLDLVKCLTQCLMGTQTLTIGCAKRDVTSTSLVDINKADTIHPKAGKPLIMGQRRPLSTVKFKKD